MRKLLRENRKREKNGAGLRTQGTSSWWKTGNEDEARRKIIPFEIKIKMKGAAQIEESRKREWE